MRETLDHINETHGVAVINEGGARGADEHAKDWDQAQVLLAMSNTCSLRLTGRRTAKTSRCSTKGKLDVPLAFLGGEGTADMV